MNKYQEAINTVEFLLEMAHCTADKLPVHIDNLKELVDKAISKKPILCDKDFQFKVFNNRIDLWNCPKCGSRLNRNRIDEKSKYCTECGQEIDWR